MSDATPFERMQEDLNPHRAEDLRRAAATIAAQLYERGVDVGDADGEEVADVLSAVERFESAVMERGGDRMVNAPDSNDPENEGFVLPKPNEGEPLRDYIGRLDRATARVASGRAD